MKTAYHWLHQLDTIVLRWVVRCRDHDTHKLSIQLAGTKSCNETNTGQNRVENIADTISQAPMDPGIRGIVRKWDERWCEWLGTYAFVRNYASSISILQIVYKSLLTPAVP